MPIYGIASLPGFEASLRLLVEREGYSLTDIALMFIVSKERIRQLCAKYGIATPTPGTGGLNAIRLWDDRTHRFYPIKRPALADVQSGERRAKRARAYFARAEGIVARVRVLVATMHPTPPNWFEIYAAAFPGRPLPKNNCTCSVVVLSAYYHRAYRDVSRADRDEFRALCGLPANAKRASKLRLYHPSLLRQSAN